MFRFSGMKINLGFNLFGYGYLLYDFIVLDLEYSILLFLILLLIRIFNMLNSIIDFDILENK